MIIIITITIILIIIEINSDSHNQISWRNVTYGAFRIKINPSMPNRDRQTWLISSTQNTWKSNPDGGGVGAGRPCYTLLFLIL